ncbi:MAG: HAMP domain-containing protein [Treponema sp.]|nr:HAMP domain-containing protein [Treponema sp.]
MRYAKASVIADSNVSAKVKYPIGAKLVFIITVLLLLSLGVITILVSVMVSSDVRVTAEDNNFTINQRSAAEAENSLKVTVSTSLALLDTLDAVGKDSPAAGQAAAFFFDRNQDIAVIAQSFSAAAASTLLLNDNFLLSNGIDRKLIDDFFTSYAWAMERSIAGETLLLNTAPVFGIPVLAIFYPWQASPLQGADKNGVALIVFSSDSLTEAFGTGANASFMVNGDGDVLAHPETGLVMAGANIAENPLVELMTESTENSFQTLYTDLDGTKYFGAFRKLSMGNAAVITNVEYKIVFEGIAATTRRNMWLTGAVLFIAIMFIWFFSKTISRPLKALTVAAEKIEAGQFELDLKPETRDEIGVLTTNFIRMSKALEIFGRFTNRHLAVRAMRGEIKPGGLPKHATIFFSDIRGFTEKSEKFTRKYHEEASNKIIYWLNNYFTRMVECVEKTDGIVDKYMGDGLMAHWGTAFTSGSAAGDALNCVKAAIEMRKALAEMNSTRTDPDNVEVLGADEDYNPPIRIGCGINTGIVSAGQLGSDNRMEYTVIGDPVNLASRTEALNKPLHTDILITEDTWNLIADKIIVEEMPPAKVKGKEKPLRVFAVINLAENSGGGEPETLKEVQRFIGYTDSEIAQSGTSTDDAEDKEKKFKFGGE